MQEITQITSSPKQHMTLLLENNETVDFSIYFLPRQQNWFIDFSYKNITVNCMKVVLSPNILRQFKKIIPFGLKFSTDSSVEPFSLTDFSSGRIKMFILNAEDVQQTETEIYD